MRSTVIKEKTVARPIRVHHGERNDTIDRSLLTPVKRLKKRFKNARKKVAVDPFWILIVLTMTSLPIPYPFVSFITARSNIYFHHLCTNFYSNLFIQLYWNQIFFGNFIFILFLEFRKSCFLFN